MRKNSSISIHQAQQALDNSIKERIEAQRVKSRLSATVDAADMVTRTDGFIIEDLSPGLRYIQHAQVVNLQPELFELEHLKVNGGEMQPYRTHFYGKDHKNLLGTLGDSCISVSLRKQQMARSNDKLDGVTYVYRGLIRTEYAFTYVCKTEAEIADWLKHSYKHRFFGSKPSTKEVLIALFPDCEFAKLKEVDDTKLPVELLNIEDKMLETKFKFGLLHVQPGQGSNEDAIFSNDGSDQQYQNFLKCIGTKVTLKGYTGFRGGLDVKDDTTGTESVVAKYQGMEVMFHVATMLPYTPHEKQQLARKAHVGNDLGILVFKTSSEPFNPTCIVSQFPHYYIIVEPVANSDCYRVSVTRKDDVLEFGPSVQELGIFQSGVAFQHFLLSKLINGETASYSGEKFSILRNRTRRAVLEELNRSYLRRSNTNSTSSLSQWTSQFFNKDEPSSPKIQTKRLSSSYNLTSRNSVKRRTDYVINKLDAPEQTNLSRSNPKLPQRTIDLETPPTVISRHRGSSPLPMPLPPKQPINIGLVIEHHLNSDDEFGSPATTHQTFNDDGTPILSPLRINDDSEKLKSRIQELQQENQKLKVQLQTKLNDEILQMMPIKEDLRQSVDQQRLRLKLKKAQAFIEALLVESEDMIDEIAI